MVDRDVVARKALAVEHHVARLRAKQPLDAAVLDLDEGFRNDVCFDLLQAVQACIDLAVHICTYDALGVPEGAASAFVLLSRNGVVDSALSGRLARAAALRNLLVHQYADLDSVRLARDIEAGLGDLTDFTTAARRYAARRPDTR